MATINSTLISGAGAFTALLPLLTGKQRILLVTDATLANSMPHGRSVRFWKTKGVRFRSLIPYPQSQASMI